MPGRLTRNSREGTTSAHKSKELFPDIAAIKSTDHLSDKRKSTKINFLVPRLLVGGVPRKEIGVKRLVPSLESLFSLGFKERENWDVPGILPGCPGPLGRFKKFVQRRFTLRHSTKAQNKGIREMPSSASLTPPLLSKSFVTGEANTPRGSQKKKALGVPITNSQSQVLQIFEGLPLGLVQPRTKYL